jgi:hypothetical protein
MNANFSDSAKYTQYRYTSNEPTLPGYYLTPEWVGGSWGVGNSKASNTVAPATGNICSMSASNPTTGTWAVHADFLPLSLPKYNGLALRLRYFEGTSDFMSPSTTGNWLREDWWFIENVGLVRIDTKQFGNYSGFSNWILPCSSDPDCLVNDVIQNPNVTMTRADFLADSPTPVPPTPTPLPTAIPRPTATPVPTATSAPPTPTPLPKPGDANGDKKVDGLDYVTWLGHFGQTVSPYTNGDFNGDSKIDGLDYVIWLGNYGK